MRIALVGGQRDGESCAITPPLPSTLRVPVMVRRPIAFSEEDSPTDPDGSVVVVEYRLAYSRLDRRPFYVEGDVFANWTSLSKT
jgi:hypothetical protein